LEEEGVGRPSTYATIVRTIQDRGYVNLIDKKFQATDLGIITDIALHQHFNEVVNVAFTAEMEAELDKVETDSKNWKAVLQEFYHPFEDKINKIEKSITKLQVDTDVKCPECNKIMRVTFSSTGKFLTCSTYPTCKSTKNIPRDYQVFPGYYEDNMVLTLSDELEKVLKELEEEMKNVKVVGECEKCGSEMVEKTGRFGLFAACTGYPKCKNTKAIPKTIGVACPNENCKGDVVIRRSKRGRIFFSCTTYPDCDFVSWERPLDRKCPKCNNYMVAKKSKAGEQAVCSDKECKHKEDLES
jgi:DNA topoisomerase-1